MPKLNTTVKSVRIDNNVLEGLEKKLNGRTFNSWLNEKINESIEGKPEFNECKPNAFSTEAGKDLMEMLSYYKVHAEKFIVDIRELMQNGTLTYENGELRIYDDYNIPFYLKKCAERKLNPKVLIDRCIESLR